MECIKILRMEINVNEKKKCFCRLYARLYAKTFQQEKNVLDCRRITIASFFIQFFFFIF